MTPIAMPRVCTRYAERLSLPRPAALDPVRRRVRALFLQ
jgi:hypothetical protein